MLADPPMTASSTRQTVAHIFEEHAQAQPHRPLFRFIGGDGTVREQYSYGSFFLRINQVALSLLKSGLRLGQPCCLIYPPGIEMAVAFFACMRIGVVPIPAPPPVQSRRQPAWSRLGHIINDAGAIHVLTTAGIKGQFAQRSTDREEAAVSHLFAKLRWIATDSVVGSSGAVPITPSEILLVQYTSGSTSAPRGVTVSHGNAIHNASLCVDHDRPSGYPGCRISMTWDCWDISSSA